MNIKKILLISILLLVLSVTAVSAADLNETQVSDSSLSIDNAVIDPSDVLNSEKVNVVEIESNDDSTPGTFDDLQKEINNAPIDSVIDLTKDYQGNKGSSININKDLTIDGHGHTINCLWKSGASIFYSTSGTIVLKNLKIINGHNTNNAGGAIRICGSAQYTIENCTFENNQASDFKGGAIYNSVNKPLAIKDCQFIKNGAQCGGAIWSDGKLIIENSKFKQNAVSYDGGAVYADAGLDISNTEFSGNEASTRGGAVYSSSDAIVSGCLFDSNKVYGDPLNDCDGGAIYGCKNVNAYNSTFKFNEAYDYGGAIYCKGNVNINTNEEPGTSISTSFIKNSAKDDNGGAIYAEGKCTGVNAEFSANNAKVDGGAIFTCGNAYVYHCQLDNNRVEGAVSQCYGGAIRSKNDVTVFNSTFRANYAEDYGGAIYANNIYINGNQNNKESLNSFFIGNSAKDDKGGAIYADGNVNAVNAEFRENKAKVDGGAIFTCGNTNVNHCLFVGNKASGAVSQCYGGAIRSKNEVTVNNSTFENNTSEDYGGAIYATNVYINTNSDDPNKYETFTSFFINNHADDDDGGAIYAEGNVKIIDAKFSKNKALVDGGAIFCKKDLNTQHCIFESNKATGAKIKCYGGAIRSNYICIDNCTFEKNFCDNHGGAVYADSMKIVRTPSYFIENTVAKGDGGAIYVDKFADGTIMYATFRDNSASSVSSDGGAIYINKACTVRFECCAFVSNHCGDEGGAIYLDSTDDKINLVNNIFIGNNADDDGDSVYNKGDFGTIKDNYWGGVTPTSNNNQLIEWMPLFIPNWHEVDTEPLELRLTAEVVYENGKPIIKAEVGIYKIGGGIYTGDLYDMDLLICIVIPNLKIIKQEKGLNKLYVEFLPETSGKYTVLANLYDFYTLKKIEIDV
jgi:predicted outer membrane repeat protein